jgi:hypothetical protein
MLEGECPRCKFRVKRKIRDRSFETKPPLVKYRLWREYTCSVCRHVWYALYNERTKRWNIVQATPPEGLFD